MTTPSAPRLRAKLPSSLLRLWWPLGAAVLYLVAALALTFPVWHDPTGSISGAPGDPDKFMGFLAWFPFAVTHAHNPLHMSWIDLPAGINAMWDTTMPLPSMLIWPVRAVFGIVAAYNVLLVAALMLDGLCTFIWLRRHTRHQPAAMVSSLLLVAGPYAVARSYGHLNLLLFFALPLMFMVVEDLLRQPTARPLQRGAWLGVLAAVQLLCTEELLALAVIAMAIAIVLATLFTPRVAWRRIPELVPAALGAVAGVLVLGGVPLAYQFFGPLRIHGPIQPHDLYVNDLLNFVIPTRATAIALGGPGLYSGPTVPWTGNPSEWNAYIGVPLILVVVFCVARWWRCRWLLVIGLTTLAMMVLSLGPHLHVNGTVPTSLPMPERLIDRLSVFENILPNRFSLLMEFGLAAIVAVFLDHVLSARRRGLQVAGAGAFAFVVASLWPATVPAAAVHIPRYFQAGGDVSRIPAGTAALVFPIPYIGPASSVEPAMWQAVADFRFKMVSGASFSATPTGTASFGTTAQPLGCVIDSLQLSGSTSACGATPSAILDQLRLIGTRMVIVGPSSHETDIVAYFNALTGHAPTSDQGVLIWMT